jgi:twitching motility protein PilT
MKTLKMEKDIFLETVIPELRKSSLFSALSDESLSQIANVAVVNQYDSGETVVRINDPSETCFMIIRGEVAILQQAPPDDELVEIARRKPYDVIGEIGLLLNQPRGSTVQAVEETQILTFGKSAFEYMYEKIPDFGRSISRSLAARLHELSTSTVLPAYEKDSDLPPPEVIHMLPMDFITRHNILPLYDEGSFLRIGFVHAPQASDFRAVQRLLPGVQFKLVQIEKEFFDKVLKSQTGLKEWSAPPEKPEKPEKPKKERAVKAPHLDPLLKRMVAEGASDLHLCADRVPRWRIDGEIQALQDARELGTEEVLEMLEPAMDDHDKHEFEQNNDVEIAYSLSDGARFRLHMFRDHRGIGVAIRLIPSTILSIEQLGLPAILKKLSEKPNGLVLLTGPAGSGKSTTLAAMIDHINKTRRVHIITMEDPIEFVHQEELALINQRQIGNHTKDYASALKSALREDPDVLLVGELRDLETISLALTAAETGHLVFATLHTSSAMKTIDRIIDVFPPDQQDQVRTSLSHCLQGIVSQTLCKHIGGGLVVASEVLIITLAIRYMIREEKTPQIVTAMQAGKKEEGHIFLNEELARLVKQSKVQYEEALSKTPDQENLAKRLHRRLPRA